MLEFSVSWGLQKMKWKYKFQLNFNENKRIFIWIKCEPSEIICQVMMSENYTMEGGRDRTLQTNQEEKVKFNWHYCYDFVTPLLL